MSATVTCNCGEIFTPAGEPGTEVRCPRCFQAARIPAPGAPSTLPYMGTGGGSGMMTQRATDLLGQTSLWVRIMSVLMFIGSGLMVLAGGGLLMLGAVAGGGRAGPEPFLGCIYIPMAVLYIIPALFLWRYATHSKAYAMARQDLSLEEALQAQKSFWKFVAITALVVLGIYLLMIPLVILLAVARHP